MTNSTINCADYVFEEDLKDSESIGKKWLSTELENPRKLEVESQDSLIEVNLGTKSQKRPTSVSSRLKRFDQNKLVVLQKNSEIALLGIMMNYLDSKEV